MTRREYRAEKRKNKTAYARIQKKNNGLIRVSYLKSITGFKRIVSRLPSTLLTEANRTRLEAAIDRSGLFDEHLEIIKSSGLEAGRVGSKADVKYLADAFDRAGVDITKDQIEEAFEKTHSRQLSLYQVSNSFIPLSRKVVEIPMLLQNRGNYSLSSSIWGGIDSFSDKIIAYVQGSLEAGIDPVKIARDLERYLREGSEFVIGQWGELVPGTSRYRKRIGKAGADYRTQRVVRTQLYQMVRDNEINNGKMNPASTGLFRWVLSPAHLDWGCECPEIAAEGPYTEAKAQAYSDSIHPNCHTGDTEIETLEGTKQIKDIIPGDRIVSHDGTVREVSHVWKQWYDGEMLTIRTNDGCVNVTPNHPLLTESGWVESRFLKDGDNVVSINIDRESALLVENESVNTPADRSKVSGFFVICNFLSRTGVPVSAIYFDGNFYIRKGKIDVIPSNGITGERLYTSSKQGIVQHALISTPELSGVELRYGGSVFVRLDGPADSVMSGTGVSDLPVGISTTLPIGDCRRCETMPDKVSVDAVSSNAEALSYLVNRKVLVNKQIVDRVIGKVVCSTHNNPIVSVSSKKYKGYVYNLTVQGTHTYIANGIGSHNCQCTLEPELKDDEEFMRQLEEYVRDEETEGAREIEIWAMRYGLTA